MNDKELAAQACALLPQNRKWEAHCDNLSDTEVVNDLAIADVLLKKVGNKLFARAIIEACVEALK